MSFQWNFSGQNTKNQQRKQKSDTLQTGWGNINNIRSWGDNSLFGDLASNNPNNDHMIAQPPTDAISGVQMHPHQPRFIVSSWDKSITMYEFFGKNQSKGLCKQMFGKPVLSCCFDGNGDNVLSAGSDNTVKIWNPQSNQMAQIGQHQAPVRCVAYSNEYKTVISGSWDRTFAIWDPRNMGRAMFIHNLGAKVYAMALKNNILVVGTSDGDIKTFDLRQNGKEMYSIKKEKKSHLNNNKVTRLSTQIRCIDIFHDGKGFVAGSVGGRVIIKHFNRNTDGTKDFSYKCHRHGIYVFAVNAIRFHQQTGMFTTAGSDGELATWNKNNKSKTFDMNAIKTTKYGPKNGNKDIDATRMPIVALDYHNNGRYLVYATSYDYGKGFQYFDPVKQKPQIYLHEATPKELGVQYKGTPAPKQLFQPTTSPAAPPGTWNFKL